MAMTLETWLWAEGHSVIQLNGTHVSPFNSQSVDRSIRVWLNRSAVQQKMVHSSKEAVLLMMIALTVPV